MEKDTLQAVSSHVSEKDWQMMAAHADMPVDKLKEQILSAISRDAAEPATAAPMVRAAAARMPVLGALKTVDNCKTQPFEVSLYKIVGIGGELKVCGTPSDWQAELKVCLIVAGAKVWCTSYNFDSHNVTVGFHPNVGLAGADLSLTLSFDVHKICLSAAGSVWYIFGKESFDQRLFCIPM
ncbi:hypothetical protein GCAAIG_02485 [Candidatus Electronema halotolerans]